MEATQISMVKMLVCNLALTLRDRHKGIRVGSHHARWKGGLMGGGGVTMWVGGYGLVFDKTICK